LFWSVAFCLWTYTNGEHEYFSERRGRRKKYITIEELCNAVYRKDGEIRSKT
jgi:hypothetical protein